MNYCKRLARFRNIFGKVIVCTIWNELSYKLNIAQIFFILGQTMGGRKEKYNIIEPIIANLNLLLNVSIDLFLVKSFLNGRRQMITQF